MHPVKEKNHPVSSRVLTVATPKEDKQYHTINNGMVEEIVWDPNSISEKIGACDFAAKLID